MRIAVIRIPGSNCDQDALYALRDDLGLNAEYVWHTETDLSGFDAIVIPGGFTYGDYLRSGAIASRAPALAEVRRFADEGKPVIGICNGFQVLTEAGVLPGALLRNAGRRFVCRSVKVEARGKGFWTEGIEEPLTLVTAHNEGRYVADDETLKKLEDEERIAFVYAEGDNPNDSAGGIAGITNERGNVLGIMPHPERAMNPLLGGSDGRAILERLAG